VVDRVGPEVQYVAMLGERLAGARQVAASHQAGVERVQQGTPDLAHLHGPEGRFDGPPDVPEAASSAGQLLPGDLLILLQQLRHGRIGFGPAAVAGPTENLAELDLRLLLRPGGGLEVDRPPDQRG
jgi:hypothetical protein